MGIIIVKRTEDENYKYVELLESAIDKAEQAISNISYMDYKDVNKVVIADLKLACSILEDCLDAEIEKPKA